MAPWGIHVGAYSFSAPFLLDLLLFIVLLFTVARHQFMERRRQAEIEMEIKSAREVQHVLIPEETPAIPGFSIASIYKPAAEVGGDFFQVMPLGEGGALIIVGDVSGKGLKAAMTVSLIVGTLRTLADYTQKPGGDSARAEPAADRADRRRLRDLPGAAPRGQRRDYGSECGTSCAVSRRQRAAGRWLVAAGAFDQRRL